MARLISWFGAVRGREGQSGEFIVDDDVTDDEIEMLIESDGGGTFDGEWASEPYRPAQFPTEH